MYCICSIITLFSCRCAIRMFMKRYLHISETSIQLVEFFLIVKTLYKGCDHVQLTIHLHSTVLWILWNGTGNRGKVVKFMASGSTSLPVSYSNHHNHPFFLHFMTGLHMLLSSPNNVMMKIWLQTEYKLLVWECTWCIRLCSITDCALSLSACTHSLSGQ